MNKPQNRARAVLIILLLGIISISLSSITLVSYKRVNQDLLSITYSNSWLSHLNQMKKLINYSIGEENPNYHVDGNLNLGVVYVVFGLSFIFAPSVLSILGCRFTMILGACGAAVCFFLFSLELTWTTYLGSAFNGYSSSIMWVAEGQYLIQNAHEHTLSRDVILFWSIYSAAQILGNVVTAIKFVGLTELNQTVRHQICYITTGMSVAGGIVLSLLKSPMGSMDKKVNDSPKKALKGMLDCIKKKNVSVLFIMFCYVGFQQSFGWSVYASCVGFTSQFGDISVALTPITTITYGLGSCAAGLILSLLPRFNVFPKRRYIVYAGLAIQILCFVGAVLNLPNRSIFTPTDDVSFIKPKIKFCLWYSAALALACAVGLGIGDTCYNTQIYTVLGLICPEASSQTVSLYKLVKSLSVAAFYFISVAAGLHVVAPITAIVGIIGVGAFRWVDLRVEKAEPLGKGVVSYGSEFQCEKKLDPIQHS